MMHWRKGSGGLGRVFSAYVALVLAIAVVSPGIAVYADETTSPETPIKGEVVAPVEPVPGAPVAEEVLPAVDPVPEADAGGAPVPQEPPAAAAVKVAPKEAVTIEKSAPMVAPSTPVIQSVYPYAPVGSVSLDGWTRSPQAKWTGGDVKGYFEGEWIPFRLSIKNTGGSAVTVQVPSMVYKVDHINGGAIAIDKTAGWRWQVGSGPVTAYSPTVQDDDGDPMYLETRLPEVAAFILQPGETGYIYFEGHLALTSYWSTQSPSYLGASGYPGSSAQARLVQWNGENIGDKTVPFPVGRETTPNGILNGLKFEDLNGNGTRETGEPVLAGWVFHLAYQDPDYGFSLTTTSAADGTFSFTGLPPGSYLLTEDQQSPYVLTTDLSQEIVVAIGATVGPIEVGNRRPNVTKTFELTVTDEVPEADSYFVRYVIGAVSTDLPLVLESGVYTADVVLPYNTTIASWQFFAMMGTSEIALSGVLGPETLTGPLTNPFEYVPGEISGHKYIDADGDGQADGPGEGWLIKLFRGGVFYDQMLTLADGSFSFTGLLPGSYTVEETEQDDYIKVTPSGAYLGPFTIVSGSVFTGVDFLNEQKPIGITTTKTVVPTLAHVGDDLTYTIDVENTGEVGVWLNEVTDPMFVGGANLLAAPVWLEPGESLSDLGMEIVLHMAAPDEDSVDNTALAEGTTVFGPVSDDDDAHVDILRPDIDITKTVVPTEVTDSGDVHYYVTVTNTGNTTLTVDVVDWIDGEVHVTLDTGLELGPGAHKDYDWIETISAPTTNIVVATGTDELGGEVDDDATATVTVDVTKTFELTVTDEVPEADSYFVRYVIGAVSTDLPLVLESGVYTADVVLPYNTTIASWQFFAMMGTSEIALSGVLGPETLTGPLTNPFEYVPGEISGHKFSDLNENGIWNDDEPALEGWTIKLYRARPIEQAVDAIAPLADPALWEFVAETITDADGAYSFGGLLPGLYLVEEDQQPGWVMTVAPDEIPVVSGTVATDADFGNHQVIHTKTFELTYEGAPVGATFSVEFTLNGEPMVLDLAGDGPYTVSLPVLYPWEIGPVTWYAHLGDATYLLGETTGETMEGDVTNVFTYTASVSGFKFSDDSGDGVWDKPEEVGLPGWTIGLYHQAPGELVPVALPEPEPGFALYASTLTAADGSYSFSGLLPGTYYVAEEQQDGWTMIIAPEGTFEIVNGSALTDLNFGNQEEFLPFTDTDLVKSANKKTAEPGELVTYTLTYTNIGDSVIEGITIVDDYDERYMTPVDVAGATISDGTLTWVDSVPLAAGESRSIVYTMRVSDDMPEGLTHVDNIAVITPGGHRATWRVDVTVEEPFLPFTGGNALVLLLIAAIATVMGVMFRRLARAS